MLKAMQPKTFLKKYARKLDLYLYEYLFEGTDSALILKELSAYQNVDGGFGHALEADLRLPDSSALATTVALQYLSQIDVNMDSPLVIDALRHLVNSYDGTRNGWLNIPPQADEYPRAPWWNYKDTKASAEWGNPSAEILGYFLRYVPGTDAGLLQKLSERALHRLNEIDDPEPHEIKCYVRLYENANRGLQEQLYGSLAKNIKRVVKTNPRDWQGYVPMPLTFIDSPDSPFADLFDKSLLLENANFLRRQIVDNSHWEPTWTWGQFEDEWAKAKLEWSGKLTVDYLRILKEFGLQYPPTLFPKGM